MRPPPAPAAPLLHSLVELTGHRDQLRLEVSILSTLQELTGSLDARALDVFSHQGALHVRPRTWLHEGQWVSGAVGSGGEPASTRLADLPELLQCIDQRGSRASAAMGAGRHRLWLPVWVQDRITGCLEITQARPFSAHKLDVLMGVFLVYQNYQSLLDYSERDALTGLLNRKTFDEHFSRQTDLADLADLPDTAAGQTAHLPCGNERRASAAQGVGHWLAVVDIDHFKLVNDRFGHLYGDEVLILMANILRSSFRSQDRVFRFGGEEFVVLLRATTLDEAQNILNRFRTTVENHHFPQVGQVTVSVGFAAVGPSAPVEIVGQADQALYYAKEHGRNRVCFYDDLISTGGLTAKVRNDDVELF